MNTKTTWWLAGAALVLFLFIVLIERRPDRQAVAGPVSTLLVPDLESAPVTAVEIFEAGKPDVRMTKHGRAWMMEAPVYHPAIIESWLQLLARTRWVVRIGEDEVAADENGVAGFGLDPAKLRIVLHQGDKQTELRIGDPIPVGNQLYVQIGDSPDVLITDELLFAALPETTSGWRDRALLSFNTPEPINMSQFDIKSDTFGFSVKPDPAVNGWRIIDPIDARADARMVSSLVFEIAPRWRIEEFVSDDPSVDLSRYGLDNPSVEVAYVQGTNDVLSVQFGNSPTNRPKLIYARQVQYTNVVLTAKSNITLLELPYTYWRNRNLIALNTNEIAEVSGEYKFGDKTFSYRIEKSPTNTWNVVEPEVMPVDEEGIQEFFLMMNAIPIESFEKDIVADFAQYGLAQPARSFSFGVSTNSPLTNGYPTLSFGTNLNEKAFARRSDERSVYAIDLANFSSLPLAHWQWRDRNIWSFSTNDVKRVIIEQHGKTREVLRTPDARWMLAPGSSGVVELSFEESVFQISELRAERWVAKGGEQSEAQFGFTEPPHRLTFEVEENGVAKTYSVRFGGMWDGLLPFAAVELDGVTWYFYFPRVTFYQHVKNNFTLPEGG